MLKAAAGLRAIAVFAEIRRRHPELIVRMLTVPLPGAVVGCAMLFALLFVRGRIPRVLKTIAEGLELCRKLGDGLIRRRPVTRFP